METEGNDAAKEQAADAMILELEALMSEVDKAQNSLDAKKRKNALDQTIEADLAVSAEESGAGEEPAAAVGGDLDAGLAAGLQQAGEAAASEDGDAKPDADAIFRELEGLTSMMDSVTQSLISARDGGSHDVGGGGEEAAALHFDGMTDVDSLPLTTSFMSSNGALPPGATPVDFSPLYGSAAASLTVSQMSNEGLASSVEGLYISQVSNEGMATSAILDTGDLTLATSPIWENADAGGEARPSSDCPEASASSTPGDATVSPEAAIVASATSLDSNSSSSSAPAPPPQTANTSAPKSASKKKSPSPLTTSSSSSSSKVAAPSASSGKASKKSKKASSPALTQSFNGDLLEPAPVAKETPENVLKGLQSFASAEAKLAELTSRHAASITLNRELDSQVKLEQRRALTALKEKELINGEHQKAILAKSKLESLCRELQKHSKMIKDEAMKRAQIEESKRKEVADSFQSTIDEVTNRMSNNSERNNALRDQNEELASKMKHLVGQYEQREEHIDKILKHKDLEGQLIQAKLDKAEAEKKELFERSGKEREILLSQTLESVKKNQMLEQNEKHLRAQIELYTEKYDEFQSTLSKSNTVFNNFKSEMAQMTKKIKKLEKEIQMWKGRWESSNTQLEKVTKDKENGETDLKEARAKASKLEKLCRALQQERHTLSSQVTQMKGEKDADGNDLPAPSLTTSTPSTSDSAIQDNVDNACEVATDLVD